MGHPREKERQRRLQEILSFLRERGGEVKFSDLYGEFTPKYGITERTFWSYLKALKNAGKIDYPIVWLIPISGEDDRPIKLLK
jgi:transposase